MPGYATRLQQQIVHKGTPALVGLDPRFDQLPESVLHRARQAGGSDFDIQSRAFADFCCRIIDVVAPLVPAVKPQAAFFEQLGPAGMVALQSVMLHARRAGLIVIGDAKRGDIGSTAEAYAAAWLGGEDPHAAPFAADALTINPYLGADTLEPFINTAVARGAGLYVLVRTSNPGAATFQDHTETDDSSAQKVRLYEKVAATVEALTLPTREHDQHYGCVGAVVGATYPDELQQLRQVMPHVPLLIPGYGAQGGGAADVASAFDSQGLGAVINSSRGINFAHLQSPYLEQFAPEQWEQAVEQATLAMIADLAAHTPAGLLR